jgi:hypothetical protein
MTKYNNKGNFPVTFTRFEGNLNNSSSKDLNIGNKGALVLFPEFKFILKPRFNNMGNFTQARVGSAYKWRGTSFSLLVDAAAGQLRVPFTQGARNYTTGYSQVDLDWVTKVVSEYDSDCFFISIYKSKKHKLGEGVTLGFYISSKDEKLIEKLYLALGGCGQRLKRNDSFIFRVQDFLSINEKIIPFFNKCGLQGRKLAVFESWKRVASLKSQGADLTLEGLNKIKEIKRNIDNVEVTCQKVQGEKLSLVLYGSNLFSTIGSRLTSIERALMKIPLGNKMSVFIGILLSDATLQKGKGDARLQFKQKYSQFEYFYSVYFQLSHYCSKGPYVTKAILHKKTHYGLAFTTRSLPCITELYNMFYVEGKKVVPKNLFHLLTWEALVHWICGDGTYNSGITLQTQCFTVEELVFIVNILIIKLGLECNIHKQDNYSVIYIRSKSIKKNLHNMLPYIHPTMLYKFLGPKYKLKSKYTTIG